MSTLFLPALGFLVFLLTENLIDTPGCYLGDVN
jgi:hypothetical protein